MFSSLVHMCYCMCGSSGLSIGVCYIREKSFSGLLSTRNAFIKVPLGMVVVDLYDTVRG